MKRTLSSLLQSQEEEKEINVFTGDPDEDMEIVSTDGETVVSAQLSENYERSIQQLLKFQITRKQYDAHVALLSSEHRMKEDFSIQNTYHALNTLYSNDRFLFDSHMHKMAYSHSTEVFRLQSRLQDIQKPVQTTKDIIVIPKGMLVELLNAAGSLFDVASKKKTLYTESSYDHMLSLLKTHSCLSTGAKYGYTCEFVQQVKTAFYSLVARMEESRDQQVPEEEAFVVPTDDQKIDTEEVNKELQEELDETLRLHAYMHGADLLKRIGVLVYHLAATVTTVE